MNFEKRDLILIAGLLLFMIGLVPFMSPFYAILIVIAMYFGIKFYVAQRNKAIKQDVGRAICADCGSPIRGERCLNCPSEK